MPKASSSQPVSGSSKSSSSKKTSEDKENRAAGKQDAQQHSVGDAAGEVERLTSKIKLLEGHLADMEAEREGDVKHFEELQGLRNKKMEQQLERVKEKAMGKHQLQEKLISTLKERVKALEATITSLAAAPSNGEGSAGSASTVRNVGTSASAQASNRDEGTSEMAAELKKLRESMARREQEWELERSSLKDQVRQLERENKAEREASKAALQKTNGTHQAVKEPAGNPLNEGTDKIRALYEDLTGLTISSVETYDSRNGYRRFRGVFANQGYHHLQLCLEESASEVPPSTAEKSSRKPAMAPRKRQELVYIPQIQDDRDAELLKAGTLPAFFLGQIRFDRSSGVKFLDKLHRGLERK
ncbi:unnamed protein product [Tilletia controversa]|uniref:Monopolin complex subunit Csm1/Pcs1 C-terminal domain-containing protein n=3 Tax=Tilletia TaxID=13289 RepID=A0A8X7MUM2_9BASI|nr:hypothetical protein CF336_g2884 [Tilletia laevis]KAE8203695.1 hypothetical protein CF328_g1506 [Tilletia controversa]KAE8264213.1 hypothetical protein A4X03_0g1108 [Tilletia caries]KAE8206190.1 hypothetical protein CF335_g2043 [Tilletia laevis]KAE8249151.1 hypothetical protein A4X06_0g3361 [Tilletia controversa]